MRIILNQSRSSHYLSPNFDYTGTIHQSNLQLIAGHILYLVDVNHIAEDPFSEVYYLNHIVETGYHRNLQQFEINLLRYLGPNTSTLPINRVILDNSQFNCPAFSTIYNHLEFRCTLEIRHGDLFSISFLLLGPTQDYSTERSIILARGRLRFSSINLTTAIITGNLTLKRVNWLVSPTTTASEVITSKDHEYY